MWCQGKKLSLQAELKQETTARWSIMGLLGLMGSWGNPINPVNPTKAH